MIDSTQQIQILQILYEIAISIGVSLDLRKMLRASLPTFLKKLNCSAGGVYHIMKHSGDTCGIEQIYAIPRNIENSASYQAVRQQIPKQLTMQELTDFRKRLPISGHTETSSHFHILELPNFGVLTLVKNSNDLDPFLVKSLTPLRRKLATACTACLQEKARIEEHNLLRALMDNMPDLIYVKDREGRFLIANEVIAQIMGAGPVDHLLGKTDFDFFSPESAKPFSTDEQAVLASGREMIDQEELVRDHRTGQTLWLLTTKMPFHDSQGNIAGIVGIGRDITARKQAEEALKSHRDHLEDLVKERTAEIVSAMTETNRLNEELRREIAERQRTEEQLLQLQKAVETTGIGVTISNNEDRIVYSNPANAAMHGYDVEEVLNKPPGMFSAPNADPPLRPPQVAEEEVASFHWKRERTSLRKDGSTFPVRLTSTQIIDAAGTRIGRVTICEDITEQKEAETQLLVIHNELKEKNAQLAELNASKDKFFSIISHDLRSPFNILLGYSNLLVENSERYSPAELTSRAQKIQTSAKKLYTLLENLLTWSRIQRGAMEYEPEPIQLNEIIEETIDLFLSQAEHKTIVLHSASSPDMQVYADYQMLHTILRNLLSNALKFTPAEGRVEITARDDGAVVEIAIADTGVGINPADLPRLFRIDSQYTRQGTAGEKGTGLGLSLCKDLVEKNHGRIWVNSVMDNGTTFTFTIPKFQG